MTLHGPRTQDYGEIRHSENKDEVLDGTKTLHCPWTQAYGETRHSENQA